MASGSRAARSRQPPRRFPDSELAHLPASELLDLAVSQRSSRYVYMEVAHVLGQRERRLADADARIRAAEQAADGLRAELRARELSAAAREAEMCRVADELADGLRDEIRERELSAAGAEVEIRRAADAEARLRAEVREWQRRAADAEERLREELGKRRQELGQSDTDAEMEAPTDGAEVEGHEPSPQSPRGMAAEPLPEAMLLEEEGRVWFPDDVADLTNEDVQVEEEEEEEGRRDESSDQVVSGKSKEDKDADHDDVVDLSSNYDKAVQAEEGHRYEASDQLVSNAEAGHKDSGDESESSWMDHLQPLAVIPPDREDGGDRYQGAAGKGVGESETEGSNRTPVVPRIGWGTGRDEQEDGDDTNATVRSAVPASEAATTDKSTRKIRGTGMFYKMVFKALKEKEMEQAAAAAAKPDYTCWLYAPRPSESGDMEDPDPQAPQK